jgi:alpha-L-fucosidase
MKSIGSLTRRDILRAMAITSAMSATGPLQGLAQVAAPTPDMTEDERMQWWRAAKFGLFMHWGLYSVAAGEWKGKPVVGAEHFMMYERIPLKEYATLADRFNPTKFNAEEWVRCAQDTGMQYMVITAKHHEGFAMYDSPSSDYNIVKRTPYKKDPMKSLAEACHKYGLRFGFYYSLGRDWEDPDVPTKWPTKGGRSNTWDFPDEDSKVFSRYFYRKVKPQIRELLTQYGTVDILWFDTPELIPADESLELKRMIREIQPACIINSRIGNKLGDYDVSEQNLASHNPSVPWEACMTMSRHWGYFRHETGWKSPEVMLRDLITVVSTGGNLLLDIGPSPEGEFPPESVSRMHAIGEWMKVNSDAIFGSHTWTFAQEVSNALTLVPAASQKAPSKSSDARVGADAVSDATSTTTVPEIRFTAKGNDIFLFAMSWKEALVKSKSLSNKNLAIEQVEMLGASAPLSWHQDEAGLTIQLPDGYATAAIPIYVFRLGTRVQQQGHPKA